MTNLSSGKQLKQALKDGKKTSGAFLQLASNISADIMGRAGFDWLMVDMEHAPGDYINLLAQLQAMNGTETVPFVRAPWNEPVAIKKILDLGVQGVLIPYVNSGSDAEAAVAACQYPPKGIRGVAGSPRAAGFGQNIENYLANADANTLVIVAIETPEAIRNLDDILAVEDVDGIFIGPMDLATSMGFPSNPNQKEVREAIESIERKVLLSDKFLGTVATNQDDAAACYDKGYQWLILMQDSTGLASLAAEKVATFNKMIRQK